MSTIWPQPLPAEVQKDFRPSYLDLRNFGIPLRTNPKSTLEQKLINACISDYEVIFPNVAENIVLH